MRICDWSSDVCSSDLAEIGSYPADVDSDRGFAGIAVCQHPDVAGRAADIHDDAIVGPGQEGGTAHTVRGARPDREYRIARRLRRRDQGPVVLRDIKRRGDAERGECAFERRHDMLRQRRERGVQDGAILALDQPEPRSEEHTSELQSLMRISYAVFCLTKKN